MLNQVGESGVSRDTGSRGTGSGKIEKKINLKKILNQHVKTCYLFGVEVWYVFVSKCRSY
jgi:hypothetical protein